MILLGLHEGAKNNFTKCTTNANEKLKDFKKWRLKGDDDIHNYNNDDRSDNDVDDVDHDDVKDYSMILKGIVIKLMIVRASTEET